MVNLLNCFLFTPKLSQRVAKKTVIAVGWVEFTKPNILSPSLEFVGFHYRSTQPTGYKDIEKCAKGLVSEECGGNKVK